MSSHVDQIYFQAGQEQRFISYHEDGPLSSQKGSVDYSKVTPWQCQNPTTITVKDLLYVVPDKELLPGCTTTCGIGERNSSDLIGNKVLLDRINMIARPGELLAIVGPSGGGKTTLLNVLALRSPAWRIPSGHVTFNGQFETKESVKSMVNYVMAHDKMLPYLTVYETLVSVADLKLPELSKKQRLLRVETVIEDMCLTKCRNMYIGGEWRKGISTGEMKRVAIGMELLDEPSVLILDEPTSGLDSTLSVKIIESLLKEARKGTTVIATVHQPSSQVFEMFDRLLLISRGQVVFLGAPDKALPYFAKIGYLAQKDWNPSDFLLDLVSDHSKSITSEDTEHDDEKQKHHPYRLEDEEQIALIEKWNESEEFNELVEEIDTVESEIRDQSTTKMWRNRKSPVRWSHEVCTLWKRQTRNSIRNPLTAIVTILVQAMQGLILGGIFFHLSTVGPGPKPDPLLSLDFWNNPWVIGYTKGVDMKGNHPLVSAFEVGVDGNGSYVLGTSGTPNSEWQRQIHWLLDEVVTTLYNQRALGMKGEDGFKYPKLVDMKHGPSASWDDWTPRRIYTNIMAAYQIFDREWPNEKHHPTIDWKFFNRCFDEYITEPSPSIVQIYNFYICIMASGKKSIDPLVTSVGLKPLPGDGRRLSESENVDTLNTKLNTKLNVDTKLNSHSLLEQQSAERRSLISIGGNIGMSKSIEEILGEDLLKIIHAADKWVIRLTSCRESICNRFKSIYFFFANWIKSTVSTVSDVLNFSGCLFFVVSVLGFASYDALLTFPQERAFFNRETANGLYRTSSYYIAKNLADLPFQVIPCLIMSTIFYFMVGFDVTAKQYFIYFAVCFLTTFCAYGFGYMVSAGAPRMEIAILIAPLTLVVWLTLAGYFLRDGDVPAWINWFKYLSFYRWSFFALVVNQFPPGGYFGTLPNTVNLALSGVTDTRLGLSVGLLVLLGFAYRILGFIFLATTNRRVGLEA